MNIQEIIAKKRDSRELDKNEIEYFVREYTNGEITDYHAAALIMAICINGMTESEIANLTMSMANSGEKLDLSKISENVVDKHSTGGVGDKITLILMPIIASIGIPVAKMSGRGLGITGGTIDKLKSIPGYNTDVSISKFIENVQNIRISLIGQTENIVPADKKIYALRDAIACTKSIPLIASSIMSKKIASGANKIVLDVTVGSGAFMKTKQEAEGLAKCMNKIGKMVDKETISILTNMDEPLGYAIGNNLEIKEAIDCLRGNIPDDVKEIVETMGAYMIYLSGLNKNINENIEMVREALYSRKAFNKFIELVENQGGDISYIKDPSKFEKSKYVIPILSEETGYIKRIDAEIVGSVSRYLGAGRVNKEDDIDYTAGILLNKKTGEYVEVGEALAYINTNDETKTKGALLNLAKAFEITNKRVSKSKTIIEIITK